MGELATYETARRALAACVTLGDAKRVMGQAEATALYARRAKDTELLALAHEIRIRAQRRCGEMLAQALKDGTRKGRGNSRGKGPTSLDELGVTRQESSAYQQLAALPVPRFEAAIVKARETVGYVTARHMAVIAREWATRTQRKPPRLSWEELQAIALREATPKLPRATQLARELTAWLQAGPVLVKPQRVALARLAAEIERALRQ